MFTLTIANAGLKHSTYTLPMLRKEARSAVRNLGKVHGINVQVNEDTGHVSLHVSYTAHGTNVQSFVTHAI